MEKKTVKRWLCSTDDTERPSIINASRKSMYELCFALNLSLDDTKKFFSHVYYDRSFNCHCLTEAAYYYCIANRLSYANAKDIIRIVQEAPDTQADETLYTRDIVACLEACESKEEVIAYLTENKSSFDDGNWNKCARKCIDELLLEIQGKFNENTNSNRDLVDKVLKLSSKNKKEDSISSDDLKDCGLLIRELCMNCIDYPDECNHKELDTLLQECGYEALTACNPYDWIFLSAANSQDPLNALRNFIASISPQTA